MRTPSEWQSLQTSIAVQRAVSEAIRTGPLTALARSGALYTAATTGPDTLAPTDNEGNPIGTDAYFTAGDAVGVKAVRR